MDVFRSKRMPTLADALTAYGSIHTFLGYVELFCASLFYIIGQPEAEL
jgi:hypothetical protein